MSRGLIDRTLEKLVDNSPKVESGSIQIGGTLIQWGYTTTNSSGYALPYFGKTFSNTPMVYATSAYVQSTAVHGQNCNIRTNGNGRTTCVGVRHLLAGDRRRITPERGCAA